MSNAAKKEWERLQIERFFGDETSLSIEDGERPDFRICRPNRSPITVEVTEYHPRVKGADNARRAEIESREIESRWRENLAPAFDCQMRQRPALRGVCITLGFNNPLLPQRKDQAALVGEVMRLVDYLAGPRLDHGRLVKVGFAPKASLSTWMVPEAVWTRLSDEDWPIVSRHIDWINLRRLPGVSYWLPCHCIAMDTAWCGPSGKEFGRILTEKTRKAAAYDTGGLPLWLLIVCETPGDLQSHVFPISEFDYEQLVQALASTGVDFKALPFAEVWLFSWDRGGRTKIFPTAREAASRTE